MNKTNHIIDLSNRLYRLAIAGVLVVAVFVIAVVVHGSRSLPQNAPHEISVSGSGKAFGKPDIALISFGVHSEALKSQDAVNKNNSIMNSVITSAKDSGVEDKDIQTTAYNLSPLYDYTDKGRVFKGYSLDQQVQVKIRNFDKISNILDGATSSGANTVGDLQFAIDNPEAVAAEARAKAIEHAKEKLADIIKQSGLEVGKLVNISEGYAPAPQPMYGQGMGMMKESANVAPQIQTGQMGVDSTVTLTYQIK